MELVIDANVFMSSLISTQGRTFDLIFNDRLRLFAPEFLLDEVKKYREDILSKSGLSDTEFEQFLSLVSSRIDFLQKNEFESFLNEARELSPDVKDTEYFALALKLKCNIWSNDKKLKEQKRVIVYSTSELLAIV